MKRNHSKYQAITFGRVERNPVLTCEGTVIPSQDEMELLGVTIDNKLKFERQIRKISRKVSQPSVDEAVKLIKDMKETCRRGIPQIVGAIDGCHIEINAPTQHHEDYFNRKQHYSVNLQAIVDVNLKFIHATVGYPGSIHDARVLRLSGLYDFAENEQILSCPAYKHY